MNAEKIALETLPSPKKNRGGQGKLIVITLLAVALVGGAAFWFTRDEDTKVQLKAQVQSSVESAVQGTPLESVAAAVSRIFSPPPLPPVGLSKPSTAPGTLAGQVVLGTVPSPVDPGVDALLGPDGQPLDPNAPESGAPALPKVEEDSVVRSLFLQDLAQWMVQRYQPGKGGGSVNIGVQAANQRYATSLRGITYRGDDMPSGREALFRYAFTPSMLRALYGLYVDRFVEELGQAAVEPPQGKAALSPEQIDDMYRAYASRFNGLGALLDNISRVPDLRGQMETLNKSAQKAVEIHTQIAEAVFALDESRENGSPAQIQTAQLRVDGLNARYLRAINERSVAQQTLVTTLRGTGGARGMDEDTVLFVGNWIERRMNKQPEAQRTAEVAAQIMYDLSRRLNQAASVAR